MNNQEIALTVHINSHTLVGNLSIPEGSRISDFLNNKTLLKTDFIKLTDVTVKNKTHKKETLKTVYINKNSIQMITTLETDSARGIGAKAGQKFYPYTKKIAQRKTISLPGYELNGYLYSSEADDAAFLNDERTFIPCTDTQVYDIDEDKRWKIEFAALNKNHISCFAEN